MISFKSSCKESQTDLFRKGYFVVSQLIDEVKDAIQYRS